MILNQFHPLTREFTTTIKAPINPKQPGKYLSVVNAVVDPLPKLAMHQTAVRSLDNTEWNIAADYRGTAWHKRTKEKVKITELGPLDSVLTLLDPSEFDIWNMDGWITDIETELLSLKKSAIISVVQFATQTRELIAGKADQYKVGGWQGKRDRAMRIKQNIAEDDDIAIVQREADKRGKDETVDQLVELQLTRARNLALGTSDIDGTESAAKTRVNATKSKTELAELMLILKQEADQYIADLKTELALS